MQPKPGSGATPAPSTLPGVIAAQPTHRQRRWSVKTSCDSTRQRADRRWPADRPASIARRAPTGIVAARCHAVQRKANPFQRSEAIGMTSWEAAPSEAAAERAATQARRAAGARQTAVGALAGWRLWRREQRMVVAQRETCGPDQKRRRWRLRPSIDAAAVAMEAAEEEEVVAPRRSLRQRAVRAAPTPPRRSA